MEQAKKPSHMGAARDGGGDGKPPQESIEGAAIAESLRWIKLSTDALDYLERAKKGEDPELLKLDAQKKNSQGGYLAIQNLMIRLGTLKDLL